MQRLPVFLEQVKELIAANGWENQLIVEWMNPDSDLTSSTQVRIRLSEGHRIAPLALVNEYSEGIHPFDQIQQECLRALRTGSPGI